MTKLPSEIKLGNRNIAVEIGKLDDNVMGIYDFTNFKIVISETLSKPQMVETFWHELMHAIFDYNRVGIELQMEMEKESGATSEDAWNLEERMAENFAKVFLQVIQDNNLLGIKS